MKLRIFFKTPDAVDYAVTDTVRHIEDEEERYDTADELTQLCGKFIRYGEAVTIELDSEDSDDREFFSHLPPLLVRPRRGQTHQDGAASSSAPAAAGSSIDLTVEGEIYHLPEF